MDNVIKTKGNDILEGIQKMVTDDNTDSAIPEINEIVKMKKDLTACDKGCLLSKIDLRTKIRQLKPCNSNSCPLKIKNYG